MCDVQFDDHCIIKTLLHRPQKFCCLPMFFLAPSLDDISKVYITDCVMENITENVLHL